VVFVEKAKITTREYTIRLARKKKSGESGKRIYRRKNRLDFEAIMEYIIDAILGKTFNV